MLGISFIFGHIFVLPHPALNSSYWHLGRAECEVKIHLVVGRTYECMRKKAIRRHFAAHRISKTVNRLINYDLVIVVKNGSWPTIRPETFCVKFVIHQVCVCTSVRVCVLFP